MKIKFVVRWDNNTLPGTTLEPADDFLEMHMLDRRDFLEDLIADFTKLLEETNEQINRRKR